MRRSGNGREPLRGGAVGPAGHDHPAVAPRLRGDPLDGVVAVGFLGAERIELAAGREPAAHVLAHDRQPGFDRRLGVERRRRGQREAPVVGGAVQMPPDGRASRRTVDVGAEHDAVAHRDGHVAIDDHACSIASDRM